jgi:hypothetical protein
MNKDKLLNHLTALEERHQALDVQIQECYDTYKNDFEVEELKKTKLYVKLEIEKIRARLFGLAR